MKRKAAWLALFTLALSLAVFLTPSVSEAHGCSSTYRQGSKGSCVKDLQQHLTDLGYSPGAIDGVFGPQTKEAVLRFQKDKGLTADGIVGKQTWAAINAATANTGSGTGTTPAKPSETKKTCPVQPLTPMTDPVSLRMEAGDRLIWDLATQELRDARDKFEALLKEKGWRADFTSAYRTYEYQKHLWEILNRFNDSRLRKLPECEELRKQIIYEKETNHELGSKVAHPDGSPKHYSGHAFDATIYDNKGKAQNALNGWNNKTLDALAKEAGLFRPLITSDGVHFQLIGK